jgi:hypothetical protein
MNQFDTPEKLTACMNDLSRVGWIGAKLPKTSFILTTQFISSREYEKLGGYSLAPGYESALLKWFSANQDPMTGAWGPRERKSGRLMYGDLNCTYRIIKLFLDDNGKERYASFPLQYRKELFHTILQQISQPMPDNLSSAEIHDWNLSRTQAVKLMTLDLWKDANAAERSEARMVMSQLLRNRYEKFYRAQEGAFVYYPDTDHATLDGTGTALYLLDHVGALSDQSREALWGAPAQTMKDLGEYNISEISGNDLKAFTAAGVNSIRIYATQPQNNLTDDIVAIVYPRATKVLDVADLMPRLVKWLKDTPQSMGNWTSREEIYREVTQNEWPFVPIYQKNEELESVNRLLQEKGYLVLIGLDDLQIPRMAVTFKLVQEHS